MVLHRTSLGVAVSLLLSVLVLLGSCASGPAPAASTSSTAPTTTSAPFTGTDCGTIYYASGWPTTTALLPSRFDCLLGAFPTGESARMVERRQTDGFGGRIEITTWEVVGPGTVRVTVDRTAAEPPGGVAVRTCTGLTLAGTALATSSCTSA